MFRNGLGNRPFDIPLSQGLPLKQPFWVLSLPFKKMHRPAALKCFETASETAPSTSFFLKAFPSNSPSGRRCALQENATPSCLNMFRSGLGNRPVNILLSQGLPDVVVALQENAPPSCLNVSKQPRNPPLQHFSCSRPSPQTAPPGCCCCPSRKRAFLHFRRTRRMARRNMASCGLCLPVMRARGAVTTDHNSCSSGSSSVRPLTTGAAHASRCPVSALGAGTCERTGAPRAANTAQVLVDAALQNAAQTTSPIEQRCKGKEHRGPACSPDM